MERAIIFGAGLSGLGAKELLEKKGYETYLIDDSKTELKSSDGIELINKGMIDLIIKSPGIPWEVPLLKAAEGKNIEVISEIDLAYRYVPKDVKIISVTGTNGKTTTATKIWELLEKSGLNVRLAGNAGFSFAKLVAEEEKFDYVVLELSSYQLERKPEVNSHIAGIINLTPDHLTRYESLEDYYITKFNIFDRQQDSDFALINLDDSEIVRLVEKKEIKAKKIFLSTKQEADIFVKDGKIYVKNSDGNNIFLINTTDVSLKGAHNLENVMFISAVGIILQINPEVIRDFLENAKPLEHRLENFLEKEKVVFVNDSKGTNSESTIKAIEAFEEPVILICGGYNKQGSNEELIRKIVSTVDFVYLMGETADILEKELQKKGYLKYKNLKTIDNILCDIKSNINFSKKQIVLFSPATSSFDQFKNFEERGKIFKKLANEIIGEI